MPQPAIPRRKLLLTVSGAAVLTGCSARTALAEPPSPVEDPLAVLERRDGVLIGVYAVDLVSGRVMLHRASDRFAICSVFKTYLAAQVLQLGEQGKLALTDTLTITAGDPIGHSPVTEAGVGHVLTLAELCQAVLGQSDNGAANRLMRVIGGPAAVTAFARSIGDYETRLDRWETDLNSAVAGDPRDTTTAQAIGLGYRRLLTGQVLSARGTGQLKAWMLANQTSSLRPGLPAGWTSADKTGSGGYGSTNDVGVAYGPQGQQVLLSLMARSVADDPGTPSLRPLIAELTRLLLPALSGAT